MTVTEKLANFITETKLEEMPPEVVTLTKRAMIDTLGVALASSDLPAAKAIISVVEKSGGTPVSGVIGDKLRTSSLLAALANGTKSHILDYDDCKAGCQGHSSAVLIPVILALGEELKIPGKKLIEAYVLGIESWARISGIMPDLHLKGWHPTATLGTIGAAAASSRLLKLTTEQTAIAIGIACSEAAGLHKNFGTMTKPLHAGNAARNGIMAALLAKEGFTGSPNILEGDSSFPLTFYGSGIGDPSKIVENLGASYAIISPGIHVKQYPSCASTHRALDAILHLTELYDIKPEDVEAVSCLSNPVVLKNLRYPDPCTALEGKFSMPFTVAAAITDRRVGLAQVTDGKVNDPVIKSLIKKVTLSVHPDWVAGKDTADTRADMIIMKLKNGKEYSHEVIMPKGSGGNPASDDEVLTKYRECAKVVLDDKATERCIELVWQLEKLADVKEIMQVVAV